MRTLFPDKKAKTTAQTAFDILTAEHPDVVTSLNNSQGAGFKYEAYPYLLDVIHTYLFERQVYERAPRLKFNAEISAIADGVVHLQNILSHAPPTLRARLNIFLRIMWHDAEQELARTAPIEVVGTVLKDLATAYKKSAQKRAKGSSGARPKSHLVAAAAGLVEMWRRAGNDFVWRFDKSLKGDQKTEEFVSNGINFVCRLLSIIDPDLTTGEILVALKKLSKQRSSLSDNSSTD